MRLATAHNAEETWSGCVVAKWSATLHKTDVATVHIACGLA
ncbi:MAG: hypothetical protein Q8K74_04730 [Candidatus Nitrotoga sp.]|nr:hypothetical protein [Candidatus Nitrotoga sp.]